MKRIYPELSIYDAAGDILQVSFKAEDIEKMIGKPIGSGGAVNLRLKNYSVYYESLKKAYPEVYFHTRTSEATISEDLKEKVRKFLEGKVKRRAK